MALKDWKKVVADENRIVYHSSKQRLRISGDNLNGFNVFVAYHSSPTVGVNKWRKTKTEALEIAKSYMRSH